jgi:hypothetical protein
MIICFRGANKKLKAAGGYYKKEIDNTTPQDTTKFEIAEEDDDEQDQLPNFNYLASLPVNAQSHLILKSEQERFQGESIVSYSKYFNINIQLLNAAIKSVPFSEIHEIRGLEWSADELNCMQERAELNAVKYKEALSKSTDVSKLAQASTEDLEKKAEALKISTPEKTYLSAREEEADNSSSKASMEKWLDDILDG